MYLRTPKKYQKGGGRGISRRSLLLAIFAGLGILLADFTWRNRAPLQEITMNLIATAENQAETMAAPAPTPTPFVDPMICLSRANTAYDMGNLIEAIEQYHCAIDGLPNDVALHTQLAFLLIVSNRPQEGLEVAKRAILADPTAPDGYAIAGMATDWIAYATGDKELYGKALAYVLRALDINPNYADAYAFMAEIYTDQGRYNEAYAMAEKALELDPENFKAHRNYGTALESQGYYEEAAARFEQAIVINGRMPYIRIQLARMYFNLHRIDDAMDLLLQAVQLTGGDPESYYWLGLGYSRYQGDYTSAQRTWETCVDVDPNYRPCWERLAGVLIFNQNYDMALNAYEKAIDLDSTDPEVYYYAAFINQLNGHCNESIRLAQLGLSLENLEPSEEDDLREMLSECRGGSSINTTPTDTEGDADQ